jgi:hypothetical protein
MGLLSSVQQCIHSAKILKTRLTATTILGVVEDCKTSGIIMGGIHLDAATDWHTQENSNEGIYLFRQWPWCSQERYRNRCRKTNV